MNALISRLISDATAPVEQMSARLFKKAALLLVAIGCLFVCSVIPYNRSFYFRPTIGWNSDRGARNRQSLPRGGFERSQLLLLPEAIDDYVVADNPVRFIRRLRRRADPSCFLHHLRYHLVRARAGASMSAAMDIAATSFMKISCCANAPTPDEDCAGLFVG